MCERVCIAHDFTTIQYTLYSVFITLWRRSKNLCTRITYYQPNYCLAVGGSSYSFNPNLPSRILLCIASKWSARSQTKFFPYHTFHLQFHCYITVYNKANTLVVSFCTLHNSRVLSIYYRDARQSLYVVQATLCH